ncbi:MAG TPA: peptidyl-alpha-hydroxyglycine alpha-amidating lyase family protein [Kofleriaceae bacterium]
MKPSRYLPVFVLAACAAPHQQACPTAPLAAGYHVLAGWPVMPEGTKLGWVVSGVGVDSRGDVFVLHRGSREWPANDKLDTTPIAEATVLVFDGRTGALRASWGANQFAMPHGLTIDRDDHVWITDVALQQVFELRHDGTLLRTFGERAVAGADQTHFDRPTKVAVAPDRSFYVSDGYNNSRVIEFASDGSFVREWGAKGSAPGQFDTPHGIALDAHRNVYVADRGNARVQVFDASGHFLREWKGREYGRPFDVAVAPNGAIAIVDGGDIPDHGPDRSAVVIVRPDGSVVDRFGRYGLYDGQFHRAHDIAVGPDGAIYVGDANGRIQKFCCAACCKD